MTEQQRDRPSLETFDAYADRNGQDIGSDSPLDVGVPARTQADLKSDPGGEAQTARIASGTPGEDASDETAAETPEENLRRIGDPSSGKPAGEPASKREAVEEAVERATAAVGEDDRRTEGRTEGRRDG